VGTIDPLYDPATKVVLDPKLGDDDTPKKDDKEEPKKEEPKKDDKKDDKDNLLNKVVKPPKAGADNYSSSKHLIVLDRQTGKLLWSIAADLGFRHNSICAGGGRLYCIDRLSGMQLAKLKRHGEEPKCPPRLLIHDLKTGKQLWQTNKDVF